jgi:hypothetical protein
MMVGELNVEPHHIKDLNFHHHLEVLGFKQFVFVIGTSIENISTRFEIPIWVPPSITCDLLKYLAKLLLEPLNLKIQLHKSIMGLHPS